MCRSAQSAHGRPRPKWRGCAPAVAGRRHSSGTAPAITLVGVRVGILTGGGDAPGLNAAIRAVARRAFQLGHSVSGVQTGWAGCLDGGAIEELRPADVRGILPLGGTILGTSRTNPLKMKDGVATVIRVLRRHGVDAMVPIGGDDTLSVAAALHDAGFQTVGVPKTIDNDLSVTEFCIGFDTAVGVVTEALDRLHTTASAHHRVMVVEVMGRDTGWVALMGGIAGGADLIIIPEFELALPDVVAHLYRRRGEGKLFSIIVVAEGAKIAELERELGGEAEKDAFGHVRLAKRGIGDILASSVERNTGFETRVTVLGHLQRGGSPTPTDRIWATRLGVHAVELIGSGKSGVIPIRRNGEVEVVPLAEVVGETRRVPADLYQLTRVFE